MKINYEMIKDKGACKNGLDWLKSAIGNDDAEYQDILDRLAREKKYNWAEWLLNKIGSEKTELKIDGNLTTESIFFAGQILVTGNIKVAITIKAGLGIEAGEGIKAGWGIEAGEGIEAVLGIEAVRGIKAGEGIKAGDGIKAGEGIEAGLGIEAGEGFGIFAGLKIKICDWSCNAKISAKIKPQNIVSGCFCEIQSSISDNKRQVIK